MLSSSIAVKVLTILPSSEGSAQLPKNLNPLTLPKILNLSTLLRVPFSSRTPVPGNHLDLEVWSASTSMIQSVLHLLTVPKEPFQIRVLLASVGRLLFPAEREHARKDQPMSEHDCESILNKYVCMYVCMYQRANRHGATLLMLYNMWLGREKSFTCVGLLSSYCSWASSENTSISCPSVGHRLVIRLEFGSQLCS